MRNSKQKIGIMIALLFIVVGFAGLTTVLVINGTVNINSSKETFDEDVIFTKAETNREGMVYIAPDGKSITYSTNELTELGQESTLNFAVTNKSRIYDADAVIECVTIDETNAYNDYISFNVDPEEFSIPASETKDGNLKISLVKSYSGEGAEIQFKCTISANAIERESKADEIVINPSETNVVSGYIFDDNNIPLANANIVIMADKPYYATTDGNGYYAISGMSNGSYPVYIMKSEYSLEEIKEMTNQEIKDKSITKGQINTSNMNIVFDNKYKQESIDEVTKYTVTFDANGGTVTPTTKECIINSLIGELPIPTRVGYGFSGWFTETSGGTQVTNNTRVTTNQTLYAQWVANSYTVTLNANSGGIVGSSSVVINYGGTKTFTVTPSSGYYLSSLSCTNGYTTNVKTGTTQTAAQTVTLSNNNIEKPSACTASFTPITYSISYTMNSGTNNSSNPNSYNVTSNAISLLAPTRTGYTFSGWTGSNGTTKQTSVTIPKGSTGNKSYSANWAAKNYTATIRTSTLNGEPMGKINTPSLSISYGGTKTFIATPNVGTYLYSLSCTNGYTTNAKVGEAQTSAQTITLLNNNTDNDTKCTANFAPSRYDVKVIMKVENGTWSDGTNTQCVKDDKLQYGRTKIYAANTKSTSSYSASCTNGYSVSVELSSSSDVDKSKYYRFTINNNNKTTGSTCTVTFR